MELVRSQNANTISEFYPHEIFHEGAIFESFLKKVKKIEFLKKRCGTRLLLYEFSRGNQVDGSPRVAITRRAGDSPPQEKSNNSKGWVFLSNRRVMTRRAEIFLLEE